MTRLCAVSVDLDEIGAYAAIHGLGTPEPSAAHAVYDVGLPRLVDLAQAHAIPLTLFAVGADLARAENAARLRELSGAGYELANHSLDHCYALTRLDRSDMRQQVQGGIFAIERCSGQRPAGFRAPGYTVTDELLEVLVESEVEYDSSVFPCPSYYAAKAAALLAIRVRGRSSESRLGSPRVLRCPIAPYRVGQPYWRRGDGLLELPIGVTRCLRLPYIGTALTLLGPDRARWLTRGVIGAPFVNLELHGIDGLDATDGLQQLGGHQPDLGIRVERKLMSLSAAVETLRAAGYALVRLDEAARRFLA